MSIENIRKLKKTKKEGCFFLKQTSSLFFFFLLAVPVLPAETSADATAEAAG